MNTMRRISLAGLMLAALLMVLTASALAAGRSGQKVRGTVTAFDGNVLKVRTREGRALVMRVPRKAKINVLSPLTLRDIKPGDFVGVTALLRGGELQALEVHVFPEAMRGTGEGHYDWDLEPGSTMTNANVDAVVATNDGEKLTLSYKGGSQQIVVPPGTPVITFSPATRSMLKRGASVFVIARRSENGSLNALRILLGSGRIKPPM
ncbi:MAG TPA: hypothetical protein VKC56_10630 [Gallionellaceae bacterium]|nr:hypothetical protein [Gallionellaceae bacterium]